MPPTIPDILARCAPEERAALLASLPEREVRTLNAAWGEWALPGQVEPPAAAGSGPGEWRTWVLMAGRGWGKTRAGAEWAMARARPSGRVFATPLRGSSAAPQDERVSLNAPCSDPHMPHPNPSPEGEGLGKMRNPSRIESVAGAEGEGLGKMRNPARIESVAGAEGGLGKVRIALVAASLDEARRVMVEGPSGLLAVARPGEIIEWSFARRRIVFASGAEATLFSGAHPEGLRGPEHDFAWCDELAKWRHPGAAWENLQLGLRRGAASGPGRARALVTTTPRRLKALRAILDAPGTVVGGGPSSANPHLPEGWVEAQRARIGPGLLGRQELGGELLDEVEGALWTRALIERCRADMPHPNPSPEGEGVFRRVVIGMDPPASSAGTCGIVACGVDARGIAHVLGDHSQGGLSPEGWARKVAAAAAAHGAQRIIAEANNGGRMVEAVLLGAGQAVPVKLVHAAEGKTARAAPVAALFEAGRARFAGAFPALEDELTGLGLGGDYQGPGASPDRADAMVWALSELMLGAPQGEPAVRGL
ncbi:MAG: terminase large subunit domain-containing protein [Sphingomonadaceae bacterium]